MSNHKAQRAIPDEYFPMVEQGMLNLAVNGATVMVKGRDVTASLLKQAERINTEYEKALAKIRSKSAAVKRNPDTATKKKPAMKVSVKPGPQGPRIKTA